MRRVVASVATAALVVACSSASIEGGTLVAKGAEPTGVTVGQWRVSGCRDGAGTPFSYADARVRVIRMIDGNLALVLVTDFADSLIVRNASPGRLGWVFALALGRASGHPHLHEYSVPRDGMGEGRFVIASEWRDRETEDGNVYAYARASVTCRLLPEPART